MAELFILAAWTAWAAFWANRQVARSDDAKLARQIRFTKLLPVYAAFSIASFAVLPPADSPNWSTMLGLLAFVAIVSGGAAFFGGVYSALLGAFLIRRHRMTSDAPRVILYSAIAIVAIVALALFLPRDKAP